MCPSMRTCQMRPICMAKEAYFCHVTITHHHFSHKYTSSSFFLLSRDRVHWLAHDLQVCASVKRHLFIWQKRPLNIHIPVKKCQKTPIYIYMHIPANVSKVGKDARFLFSFFFFFFMHIPANVSKVGTDARFLLETATASSRPPPATSHLRLSETGSRP